MTIRTKTLFLLLTLITVVAVTAGSYSPSGDMPLYLPLVRNGSELPLPPGDAASERISLPPGFQIRIFAENVGSRPRFMAFGADGHLYVSLMGDGKIIRLPDRDFNGLSDGVEVIASGLNLPHGIEFYNDWLYVAEGDKIERLKDQNLDGIYETKELLPAGIPGPVGHSSRTIHFGPDGKMYVSVGSPSNITPDSDPRRAAILRFNPDGTIPNDNPFYNDPNVNKRALYAWGLRNSVDFLWSPTGQLWANHNGSDGLGDDLPPEEAVIAVQGNFSHGWPYCYTPGLGITSGPEVRDTRVALPAGFDCSQAVSAIFTIPAHSAPLGMELNAGGNFPTAMRSDLFMGLHGSWNTTPTSIRDCKVIRISVEAGQPTTSTDFASGWRAPGSTCGDAATWGRPVDVIFGPYGEMYISDDKGNRIYRVIYSP
jgi:glucose/arabinose dehydrogenase